MDVEESEGKGLFPLSLLVRRPRRSSACPLLARCISSSSSTARENVGERYTRRDDAGLEFHPRKERKEISIAICLSSRDLTFYLEFRPTALHAMALHRGRQETRERILSRKSYETTLYSAEVYRKGKKKTENALRLKERRFKRCPDCESKKHRIT